MADAQNFLSFKDHVKLNPREEEVRRRDAESKKTVANGPISKTHIHVRQGELTFLDQSGFAFSQMSGVEESRAKNAVPYGVADTSLAPGKNTKIAVTIDGPVEIEVNGEDELKQGQEVYAFLTMNKNGRKPAYRPAANRAPGEAMPILTNNPEKYGMHGRDLLRALITIFGANKGPRVSDTDGGGAVDIIAETLKTFDNPDLPDEDIAKVLEPVMSAIRRANRLPKMTKEGFRMFKIGRVMKGAKPGQRAGINFKVE